MFTSRAQSINNILHWYDTVGSHGLALGLYLLQLQVNCLLKVW